MSDQDNPLLDFSGLPRFSTIRPEHVAPAMTALLDEGRALVARLLEAGDGAWTWEGLVAPLEEFQHRLSRAWSPVSHLHGVADDPELRAVYDPWLRKLSAFQTELAQNAELYRAYRALAHGPQFEALDPARRKVVEDALRDFHLSGVDLPATDKARFREVSEELAGLKTRFSQNVLDATQAWSRAIADEAELDGLPESARQQARDAARRRGEAGWLLTLDLPSFLPVMSYARSRELRREVYTAHVTRASDQGPTAGQWDNTALMTDILSRRHEQALLTGFGSYSEYSLARKMAHSPEAVLAFLEDLARRARPVAAAELAEVAAFARETDGLEALEPWDVPYYSEALREARFDFSQEDLRPWFAAPRVLQGLFEVVRRLYGVRVVEVPGADVWHPDVRLYALEDDDGAPLGHFYVDLYARTGKRGGAWMDECVVRMRHRDRLELPAAYLVCNFPPPLGDRPSLLTHGDVTTLFHEFGHTLHHLLTRVDHPAVAGINGVPWDAVEVPSQFMEHWCWEREALDLFARHVETDAPLPEALWRKLHEARNFQAGMQMVRQLEFALFDFRLHTDYDPGAGARVQETLEAVRAEVAVVRPPSWNRFAHGFTHIWSGGYAAGYYSYKWAEVLACDAYALFEDAGIFSPATGRRFRETILEQGGSRDPMELFQELRGRPPRIEALLRHAGIAA